MVQETSKQVTNLISAARIFIKNEGLIYLKTRVEPLWVGGSSVEHSYIQFPEPHELNFEKHLVGF